MPPIRIGAVLRIDDLEFHRCVTMQPEFTLSANLTDANEVCTHPISNAKRELSEKGENREGKAKQENERGNNYPYLRIRRTTDSPAIPSDIRP